MENTQIGVSIVCNAFNHERYIAQALESFLMQKTDFPFEILVHDDAYGWHRRDHPHLCKTLSANSAAIISDGKPIL